MSLSFAARSAITEQLQASAEAVATAMTDEFLRRHPDWVERYGDLARQRGLEDARFHIDFLTGALLADDAGSFARYAVWTAGVLSSRGIEPRFLVENLEQLREHALARLSPEARAEVGRLIVAAVNAIREYEPGASRTGSGEALPGERSLYLQSALAGKRSAALNIAREALRAGASVLDVYQDMLQPAQYEIGRLWECNSITVAKEHAATAVTQYVVARLHEYLPAAAKTSGNAVMTGVRNEAHQLGATMVTDVLEAEGWNVRFLGTALPHRDIVAAVADHEATLVGISIALLSHLNTAGDLIDDLRGRFGDRIHIIVGGAAFRFNPDVWRDLGADGFGRDLRDTRDLLQRVGA